jgi:hypothetical protein
MPIEFIGRSVLSGKYHSSFQGLLDLFFIEMLEDSMSIKGAKQDQGYCYP